jgi:cell division protein FtsW
MGHCMLLLILVRFWKRINGARSWFEFGGLSLQPSELAKIQYSAGPCSLFKYKETGSDKTSGIIPAHQQ